MWFNPPYSTSVKTNVAGKFLQLLDRCFPKGSALHKYFNRNNVKVSYSTMRNMKEHVEKHNRKVLQPTDDREDVKTCNCRKTDHCPLQGKCLSKAIIYQAEVKTHTDEKVYYGLTERRFKERFYEHRTSFNNKAYAERTELSKYVWKLKEEGKDYSIKWSIKMRAHPYRSGSKRCDLCLCEKTFIAMGEQGKMLNSRSEILGKCRHRRKFCLSNCR